MVGNGCGNDWQWLAMVVAMIGNGCSMVVNDNGNGFGNVNDGGGRLD